ncbi:MAG: peroxiredoxin [Deltaproteobacteria bacterium]|jgi:peroxiredoxin Q/BCP|nr:peroxiredoxin [Deltaproteobacteria bacterium]
MLEIGQSFPDFNLADQEGQQFNSQDLLGHWAAIYFYPKDNKAGCIREAKEFTDQVGAFMDKKTLLIGISPYSVKSQINYTAKHELGLTFLVDPDRSLCQAVGVWQKKKLYGKESFGVVRSTFLLDPEGVVREVWTKVKATGHAQAILAKLAELR